MESSKVGRPLVSVAIAALALFFLSILIWQTGMLVSVRTANSSIPAARVHSLREQLQTSTLDTLDVPDAPLRLAVSPCMDCVITDEQVLTALCAALPLWVPPTVPTLMHNLHVWGPHAEFTQAMVPHALTGPQTLETLLSDQLCRERTVIVGASYLIDSPFGSHVV